jgi:hypothetical protein
MKNYPAQLQDGFYSVGRALVRSEDGLIEDVPAIFAEESVFVEEAVVSEPEVLFVPEAVQFEPEILMPTVSWYKRLWILLNMDVRDVWKLAKERWKRAEISR